MWFAISTCQMQYDAADNKTDQEDPCFIHLRGNWHWKRWRKHYIPWSNNYKWFEMEYTCNPGGGVCLAPYLVSIERTLRGRSLFISWGGSAILGRVMNKILSQMGGGVKISFMNPWGGGSQIWFPFPFLASKCCGFWGASPPRPPVISIFFSSFMPHFLPWPPKKWRHEEICICWDALRQILLWQCIPSLDHAQIQTNAYRYMGSILTSYWYFVEQNEIPEWSQLWDWASQQAYVTRDQWTYTLTRIMFAEKHHKFQFMYVSESS